MSTETDWNDTDRERYFAPGAADSSEEDEYVTPPPTDNGSQESAKEYFKVFEAPDYVTYIRHEQTARGKEYETKINSMLKGVALGAFKIGNIVDGATILHYGPAFAKNAGDLTDVSDKAAKAIDLMTAPDNPWFMFMTAALPFAFQLVRNHELATEQISKSWKQRRAERKQAKRDGTAPPPRTDGHPITIGRGRVKFTFRVRLPRPAMVMGVLKAQTHVPSELTKQVLSDPKLIKALEKQGIVIRMRTTNGE